MDIILVFTICMIFIMLLWENFFPRRIYSLKLKLNPYKIDILLTTFNNIIFYLLSITSLYYLSDNVFSLKLLENHDYSNFLIIIITIIFLDFSIYIWHNLNHKINFLWLFHKVHHSEKYLNTLSGIRFHIGELISSVIFKSIFLIFILGIPINLILISESIILLSSLFHHSNIKFKFEKILGKIFIMPYIHEVHHSVKKSEHNSNYGVLFSFWDKLFGTYSEAVIKEIGLKKVKFQGFFQLIKYGFNKN